MKFSQRTNWNAEESELARAHRETVAQGLPVADLTESNPTRCGLEYPADLLDLLTDPAGLDYDPNPKGSLRAREAVSRYYAERRVKADPERMILTTSTSEAYSYLFKLLCDPDDEVVALQPSYPLFDFLADAEVIRLQSCGLIYDFGWQLDIHGLRQAITPRTRAVVLVHPNNPTGHFTKSDEARKLADLCREFGLALIVDEVFLDYLLDGVPGGTEDSRSSFAGRDLGVLIFVVSGISKIAGLPQMKAAWLLATGPGSDEAMSRLEVLADTYLSMNTPVQRALPAWLATCGGMQEQILRRVKTNLAELDTRLARAQAVNRLVAEGGWYAMLRIPALTSDEDTVRELLELGVWIHPGYFFGTSALGWLVMSLLAPVNEFARGVEILLRYFDHAAV